MNATRKFFVKRNGTKVILVLTGIAPRPPAAPQHPDDALLARLGFTTEADRLDSLAEQQAEADAAEYYGMRSEY